MRESKLVIKFEYVMVMRLIKMLKRLDMPVDRLDDRIDCEDHIVRLNPCIDSNYTFLESNFYADRDWEWSHDS